MRRVGVMIDGHDPVFLSQDEARALALALWRLAERENVHGGIALSIALLDASHSPEPVDVNDSQLPMLREALERLTRDSADREHLDALKHAAR